MLSSILLGIFLLGLLLPFMVLRGLPFYGTGGAGATGNAATIFDPIIGAAVTRIPQCGDKRGVSVRGATLFSDQTGDHEEYATMTIGQGGQGDAHIIVLRPASDGDNPNPSAMFESFVPLGGFVVQENEDLSIRLYDPGGAALMSGVLWYDDLEPEIAIPVGRIVTFRGPTSADYATTYSETGGGNFVNLPDPMANYAVVGADVRPEDKIVQALAVHASGKGHAAVLPPKGQIWFPSCPLVFSGLEIVRLRGQVQAGTEIAVTLYCVEIPKRPGTVPQSAIVQAEPYLGTYRPTITPSQVAEGSRFLETVARF